MHITHSFGYSDGCTQFSHYRAVGDPLCCAGRVLSLSAQFTHQLQFLFSSAAPAVSQVRLIAVGGLGRWEVMALPRAI